MIKRSQVPGKTYSFRDKKTGEIDTGMLPLIYGESNDFAYWHKQDSPIKGTWQSRKFNKRRCMARSRGKGSLPRNTPIPESYHTFPCGCSGVLPKLEESNKFAIWCKDVRQPRKGRWFCRIVMILRTSTTMGRIGGHKPIDINMPCSIIRGMMEEPDCWRCHQHLRWELAKGKTPHLHHNHETGEVYGFTHSRCNPNLLERELDKLHERVKELEEIIARQINGK